MAMKISHSNSDSPYGIITLRYSRVTIISEDKSVGTVTWLPV